MPGFVTHYLYGVDVYKSLNNSALKEIIHSYPAAYKLGLQGPDIFFYHIPFLKHNDCRNIGSYMHEHNMKSFFENGLKNIPKRKTSRERKLAISYLCGMLCHYTLDYHLHPYVYSKSQYKKDKNNRLFIGYHLALEMEMDRLLLKEKKGMSLTAFNQNAALHIPLAQNYVLSKFLNQTLKDTFKEDFKKHNVRISPRRLRLYLFEASTAAIALRDPRSTKKNIALFIEKHFMNYALLSSLFVTDSPFPIPDPLNLKKDSYENTWDNRELINESVPTICDNSLEKCLEIFMSIPVASLVKGKYCNKLFKPVLEHIGNYSYHSGLPVE